MFLDSMYKDLGFNPLGDITLYSHELRKEAERRIFFSKIDTELTVDAYNTWKKQEAFEWTKQNKDEFLKGE